MKKVAPQHIPCLSPPAPPIPQGCQSGQGPQVWQVWPVCQNGQAGEGGKPLFPKAGLVFFSGGTALNETAKALASCYPSTHIITTFDSGGSTAELRKRLSMPAVGDIRARLLALADDSQPDVAALKKLMAHRLSRDEASLGVELAALRGGLHPLLRNLTAIWAEMGDFVRQGLAEFKPLASSTFGYGGACVGNILLAVQYFRCNRDLQEAVHAWGRSLQVQGLVVPVSETLAHLAVALESGEKLVGQHRFTGKRGQQIQSPIADIWLVEGAEEHNESLGECEDARKTSAIADLPADSATGRVADLETAPATGLETGPARGPAKDQGTSRTVGRSAAADATSQQEHQGNKTEGVNCCVLPARAEVEANKLVSLAIAEAQCLCYPIGSFFSSVAANLLVKGVGQSIARASCPKVFIPNPGADPELLGLTLLEQVRFLLRLLLRDAPHARPNELLNGIVIDRRGSYVGGVAMDALKALGIELYEARLLDEEALGRGDLYISGKLLAQELLRLFAPA